MEIEIFEAKNEIFEAKNEIFEAKKEIFEAKKERCRTRWTPSLDKVFVDLVVEQIQLGNRPNNIFDKKTWNTIRNKFSEHTGLQFNNNQLRKHYDVLRIRYNNIKSSIDQNSLIPVEESSVGFDLWDTFGMHPATVRPEPVKVKECAILDQLTVMFADNGGEGKYAQSSHYAGMDNNNPTTPCLENGTPHSEGPSSSRSPEENVEKDTNDGFSKGASTNRKRKRGGDTQPGITIEKVEELKDAMAEALSDMIDASRLKVGSGGGDGKDMAKDGVQYSISMCVKALDEIEGIHQSLYFDALDMFEGTPGFREIFMSLNSKESRMIWLHEKCAANVYMF